MTGLVIIGLLQLRDTIPNVAAVESMQNIGVYWDPACTQRVNSVNWGAFKPGQTKNVTFYIRNEGNTTILLVLSTANYNPPNASNYISLKTIANNTEVKANQTILVTPNLNLSLKIRGVCGFSFDMVIKSGTYIPGDINGDGRVDIYDALLFARLFGTKSNNTTYNADADLNKDGSVNAFDARLFASDFP